MKNRVKRRAKPAAPRSTALGAALAALALTGALAGCADTDAAHVEGPAPSLPAASPADSAKLKAKHTYATAQLRAAVLRTHTAPVTDNLDLVRNTLRGCEKCLVDRHLIRVSGTVFQQAAVHDKKSKRPFALLLFSTAHRAPRIELTVTGQDVSASTGRNNTLVVQEAEFRKGDKPCCASAWAVTVYRLTDGRFDAGQRIATTASPSPTNGR